MTEKLVIALTLISLSACSSIDPDDLPTSGTSEGSLGDSEGTSGGDPDTTTTVDPSTSTTTVDPSTSTTDDTTTDASTSTTGDASTGDSDASSSTTWDTGNPAGTVVCGDGKVEANEDIVEQCDDGNTEPGDGCSAHCMKEYGIFLSNFKVSATFKELIGMIPGVTQDTSRYDAANAWCQHMADQAELEGTWRAWFSTENPTEHPKFSLNPNFDGVITLIDGTPVAIGVLGLEDSVLLHPINMTALGNKIDVEAPIFTGTDPGGYPTFGLNCQNWTSTSMDDTFSGSSTMEQGSDWSDKHENPCNITAHILCYEQF